MPAGRPSKYQETYCEEAIQCLGRGYSVAAFAGEIGVSRDTIYAWAETHEEFSDALKIGQAKSALYWEKRNIDIAEGGEGNVTATIFALKNRVAAEWRERVAQEISGPNGGPIETKDVSDLEAARRIAFLLAKASEPAT